MSLAEQTSAGGAGRSAGVPWFSIRLPDQWFRFDPWRASRTADLARLVDARVAELPALRPHRALLMKVLRDVAEEGERQGAVLGAALVEPVGEASVVASLTAFQTAGDARPGGNTVEAIAAGLTARAAEPGSPLWCRVEIVETEAGAAVCRQGVERLDGPTGPVDLVMMQTLFPVPDGHGVLDVVLTSPLVGIADAMLDLFDAVTRTVRWESVPMNGGVPVATPTS